MMNINYRDLLWDFVPDDPKEDQYRLRVFSSEEELYASTSRYRSSEGFAIRLPLKELTGTSRSRGRGTQQRIESWQVQWLGQMLWDALPTEARAPLLSPLSDSVTPLRIKISSSHPAVTDLPWEWLWDGTRFLALQPDVQLVRSVPVRLSPPALRVELPLRVLLVLTNPKDERLLNPYEEIAVVTSHLGAPDFELMTCDEPTLDGLRRWLQKAPHIVHYIGHAGVHQGEGNLILHDPYHRTHWLSASILSRELPTSVRLLCLSTPCTAPNYQILGLPRLAHTAAEQHLPTMIVNQQPVSREAARQFWDQFYPSLIHHGGNVNEAFHAARLATAMQIPHDVDWASFSLVIRDKTGHPLNISGTAKTLAPLETFAEAEGSEQLRITELRAQLATRLANDLAQQIRVLGDDAPPSVLKQYDFESRRASDFLSELPEM